MPCLIKPEVEVDGAVSVESDERTFEVVEDVQGSRVETEDVADRPDDPGDVAKECVVIRSHEAGSV